MGDLTFPDLRFSDGIHFSPWGILSRDCTFNIVEGARRIGKSTGFKFRALTRTLKRGSRTLWLRRYDTEIDKAKKEWIKPVLARKIGKPVEMTADGVTVAGKLSVKFGALTQVEQFRDAEDETIDTIIYDEATTRGARGSGYLKNETRVLLDIVESVTRGRDGVRIFLLCNRESPINPHVEYFGLKRRPEGFTGFDRTKDGLLCVQYCNRFSMLTASKLDRLYLRTEYAAHMTGKEEAETALRPAGSKPAFTVDAENVRVHVYTTSRGLWAISTHSDAFPRLPVYSDGRKPGTIGIKDARDFIRMIRTAQVHGGIAYGDGTARGIIEAYIINA